jgi:hypothetical protein
MKLKTTSEMAFESFCQINELAFRRVPESTNPTPDYILVINNLNIHVEVKQIDEDENFSPTFFKRTPGTHVRAKINQARNQLRLAAESGNPAVLLVYNNLDPLQMFGTEQHDFLAAMYGDLTISLARESRVASGVFHGRNQSLREGKNDSFSAVGWLHKSSLGTGVHLYENVYARVPLQFELLPECIQFNRVEVESAQS